MLASYLFLPSKRQRQQKNRPLLRVLRPRPPSLRSGDLAHDVEAEAGSRARHAAFVGAVESLEEVLSLVRRHSDSVVSDAQDQLALAGDLLLLDGADLDEPVAPRGLGVLERVRQVVLDAELDDRGVDLDLGNVGVDADVDLRGLRG